MDKLSAMRAFVEISDRGSLTAAGNALGKSQPTMVRTLANLEAALGVRLLRRTTRRIALTEEGRVYLRQCRRILADVEDAERAIAGSDAEPRGRLRITAPVTFGQQHVAPLIFEFLKRFRQVQIELLLLDRVVNLLEEGIDLAIRIGTLADSSMIATNVGQMRQTLVASPEFLERHGSPDHPDALANAPCVKFRGTTAGNVWRFQADGQPISVTIKDVLATNQALPAVDACTQGLGFGLFLGYQVMPAVTAERLRVLLETFEPPPSPVSIVYSDARLMSSSLRILLDFLRERLRLTLASSQQSTQAVDGPLAGLP